MPTASSETSPISASLPDLDRLDTADIVHLQRMVGNAAVIRLMRAKNAQTPTITQAASTGDTIQRALRPYSKFLKDARKFADLDETTFAPDRGEKALNKARKKNKGQKSNTKFGDFADIGKAYILYENEPSALTLSKLWDTINSWFTLNEVNRDEMWFKSAKFYLMALKDEIDNEIQKITLNEYVGDVEKEKPKDKKKRIEKALEDLKVQTDIRTNFDKELLSEMPPFMTEIGIAPRYYGKHLKGRPQRIDGLFKFYYSLRNGNVKDAMEYYKTIQNVTGMFLIKSLVINHFSQNAEMGDLIGTTSTTPGALTKAEAAAIVTYSTERYISMNAQLRSTIEEPEESPVNIDMFESFLKEVQVRTEDRKTSELVVSGLNKLPPYKGIAYRGLLWEPNSYFDVIQPGAMVVDLAFQSASPTLNGVESFFGTKPGTKHIYFMIHTRSAVNITGFSDLPLESEILFKPGVRFQVKAVWHHIGGKVPPNAPPEAQFILHTRGEFKSPGKQTNGNYSSHGTINSSQYDMEKPTGSAAFIQNDIAAQQALEWHQVKVIEMVEV